MKKVLLIAVVLVASYSCENDGQECFEQAIEVINTPRPNDLGRVNCNQVNWQDYQNQQVITFEGDTCINGSINLNSNQTIIINGGSLTIVGAGNFNGNVFIPEGNFIIDGSFNFNSGATVEACVISLSGSVIVNCGVSMTAEGLSSSGNIVWNCPRNSIFNWVHPDEDEVLSNDSIEYRIVEVPCELVDGVNYIKI